VRPPLDWRALERKPRLLPARAHFSGVITPTLGRRATECRFKPTKTRPPPTPDAIILSLHTPLVARHDHGPTTKRQCADTSKNRCNRTANSTREDQYHNWNASTRRRNQHARAQKLQKAAQAGQYAGDGAKAQIERAGVSYKRATAAGRRCGGYECFRPWKRE
jgi:hypothetical protein